MIPNFHPELNPSLRYFIGSKELCSLGNNRQTPMLQHLLDFLFYSILLSPIPNTFLSSHPLVFYWVLALFIQIYLGSVEPFYTSLFLLHGIKINKARIALSCLRAPRSFCFQSLNKSSSNEQG